MDVRANFLRVLHAAQLLWPKWLVLSGDLCYDKGETGIYQWIREQMDRTGIPYYMVPGNHDDVNLMEQVYDLKLQVKAGELYYQEDFDGQPVLFLDTGTGEVSAAQQQWLRLCLRELNRPALLFLHHPPLLAGVPHMDRKYALRNRDEVLAILTDHPHPLTLFSGHYHVHKSIRYQNLTLHITPSTYFQIDQFHNDFRIDHYRPGFCVIDLLDNQIRQTVRYLEPVMLESKAERT